MDKCGQGEGGGQPNVDRPGQREGVPKIAKVVRTSFMDDPLVLKAENYKKYYKKNQ